MSLSANMLDSTATGIRAATIQGSRGGLQQDFTPGDPGVTTLFEDWPCAYQESGGGIRNFFEQRNMATPVSLYFIDDPQLQANDLVIVTKGLSETVVKVNVLGTSNPIEQGSDWVWVVTGETIGQPSYPVEDQQL